MSVAVTSQSRHAATRGVAPASLTRHNIRWTVSSRALAAVRPELVAVDPRGDVALTVAVEISDRRFTATISTRSEARENVVETIEGGVEHSVVGGVELVHLDAPELVVTLRRGEAGAETLYARLPLLARWGIAGGRYELAP